MSSMSGTSGMGMGNAMANATAQRSQMQSKMFAKTDANSSGGVDQAELQTMFSNINQKTGQTLDAEKLFSSMDSNSDGSLASDELSTGLQNVMQPPPTTMAFVQNRSGAGNGNGGGNGSGKSGERDLFSKIDSNSDGSVNETEMTAFTDKMKAQAGRDSATSFSTLDADADGQLTQAEFDAGRSTSGSQGAQGTGGAQGSGGIKGAGGNGGARGVSGSSETSSTTLDPLDTNQDGTVSQLEKLAGALNEFVNSVDAGTSSSGASDSLMQLVKQVYEQISAGSTATSASMLDAMA